MSVQYLSKVQDTLLFNPEMLKAYYSRDDYYLNASKFYHIRKDLKLLAEMDKAFRTS